jgi:cell division protein FtsZ
VTGSPEPLTGPPAAEPAGDVSAANREDQADEGAEPVAAAAGVPARHRADAGAAARMFDAATTRRRSVVFEEDDELDVPDFLK